MAAKYDGTIRIDSKIDTGGFNNGLKSMESMVKKFAGIILAVIGGAVAGSILKLSAEFQRLELAAQAVGQMFGYTREEIQQTVTQLIESGIQADVANRAFINFAREGLDTSLLPALARGAQDLNVFADAGETSSDVLDRLLHGILTLSPIVLRHAGVAIDLMEAYKEYAKQAGISVQQMTIQEKRQAALVAVTQKLTGVTGLYELSQKTAAGQLASHTRIMNTFRAAIGAPFQSAFYELIKAWNTIIKVWTAAISPGGRLYGLMLNLAAVARILVGVITAIANAFAKIFGGTVTSNASTTSQSMEQIATSSSAAAEGQENLAAATGKAGKAAKGALAAFDELNVLAMDESGGGGAAEGGAVLPEIGGFDVDVGELEGLAERIEAIKAKFTDAFGPLIDAFERLKTASEPLRETLWSGLVWLWENVLVPFGTWVGNDLLPAFLDLLGTASETLNTALVALQPLAQWLWDEFLQPLAEWTGEAIINALTWLNEQIAKLGEWISTHQGEFEAIVLILGSFALAWGLVAAAGAVWAAVAGIAAAATAALGAVFTFLTSPIGLIIIAIGAVIAIALILKRTWPELSEAAKTAWESIKTKWGELKAWFKTNVTEPLTQRWEEFTSKLGEAWETLGENLPAPIKAAINIIIGILNTLLSAIATAINSIADALGGIKINIPNWVPGLGGKTFSIPFPRVTTPQIPKLATGAVIPPNSEFAAILGDQKSGRNIEAPEALIRQIMQEELSGIEANVNVNFTGSMAALVRQLRPIIEKEDIRIGRSMVRSIS